ncbi:MAG: hypothetical protein KJ767_00730 [Nanoarchaeota archaeon]|nr:hypothetical protein [Nanoarchaeota archaeon]
MKRRGILTSIIAIFSFIIFLISLIPNVSAQDWLIPFRSAIDAAVNSGFFMFLILLGIFSVAFVSSLMKIFPPPYAKLIGVLGGLFLTTAMFYTGVVDTGINIAGHAGLWALALLALVIILSLTSFMSKGKGSNGSLIIILIVAVILYLLFSGTISASNMLWDYLFFLMLILGLLALLWFLASGATGVGGGGGGMPRGWWPHWLSPWKWNWPWRKPREPRERRPGGEPELPEHVAVTIESPRAGAVFGRKDVIEVSADITGGYDSYNSIIRVGRYKKRVSSGEKLYFRIGTPDEIKLKEGNYYLSVNSVDKRNTYLRALSRIPIKIIEKPTGPGGEPEGYKEVTEGPLQVKIINPKNNAVLITDSEFDVDVLVTGGQPYHTLGIGISGMKWGKYIHSPEHVGAGRSTRKVTIKESDLDKSNTYSLIAAVKDRDGKEETNSIAITVIPRKEEKEKEKKEGEKQKEEEKKEEIKREEKKREIRGVLPAYSQSTINDVTRLKNELDDDRTALANSSINLARGLLTINKFISRRPDKYPRAYTVRIRRYAIALNEAGTALRNRNLGPYVFCDKISRIIKEIRADSRKIGLGTLPTTKINLHGLMDNVDLIVARMFEKLVKTSHLTRTNIQNISVTELDKWLRNQARQT